MRYSNKPGWWARAAFVALACVGCQTGELNIREAGDADAAVRTPDGGEAGTRLVAVSAAPPNWDAPRIADGSFDLMYDRSADGWHRTGVAVIPPGKRILIGPRYVGYDSTTDPVIDGAGLAIDGSDVELAAFSLNPHENYFFGTQTETHLARETGKVFSFGIVAENVTGPTSVRVTSILELNGSTIPWVEDVTIKVRPYVRSRFANTTPTPLAPVTGPKVVPPNAIVLRNVTAISATGAPPLPNAVIVFDGEWIVGIGQEADFDVSAGPTVIDGAGGFAIPGIFNAHVHYSSDARNPPEEWLAQGVTTLIDVGGKLLTTLSIREEFAASTDPRPDVLVAGPIIEAPGAGHQRTFGSPGFYAVANPTEAAAAAASAASWGVNLLKLTVGDLDDSHLLSVAEIEAIVTVAHQRGLKVMAHVTSDVQLQRALAGGVDILTHLPPLSDTRINEMVAASVVLVPGLTATYRPRADVLDDASRAFAAGVPLATGNDSLQRGLPIREMRLLEQAGLSRMQVIEASTRVAAQVVGAEAVVGTIESGKIADVVVLGANPLVSLENLSTTKWVFKRGKLVVSP